MTKVCVHTSESRGREAKYASDYEAPTERFIDIDTTGTSIEASLGQRLGHLGES
ncbi:DUF4178 domain-containing protein [Flavobacteriales bacterium]|nr:DUF4178 domain-containing protein [Flavobacteriales bacterium]